MAMTQSPATSHPDPGRGPARALAGDAHHEADHDEESARGERHDQAASTRFYRAVLLAEPTLDVPGMTELTLPGGAILGLMPEAGAARLLGAAHDPSHAAGIPRAELYVLVDDPAAYHARSIAAGAKELSPVAPRDWGHDAGYALDPDGHVVAFARVRAG
jgi:catechol 2,3-dioxygenase-like lactoylglutathione lyase family enzyme